MNVKLEAIIKKYEGSWHLPAFKQEIQALMEQGESLTEKELYDAERLALSASDRKGMGGWFYVAIIVVNLTTLTLLCRIIFGFYR